MSSEPTFLQIVPRKTLPPSGVVDYGLRVAEGLRDNFGAKTIFLAGPSEVATDEGGFGWPAQSLAQRSAKELEAALDALHLKTPFQCILVHVSGYGYARRGAPFWLARGLARWLAKRHDVKVIGVFHELFATGNPWRSSFWFGPLQALVTRRIWALCNAAITTNTLYEKQLRAWRSADCPPIELLPVMSTVGEPVTVAPFDKRERAAIVFASPGVEKTLYADCRAALELAVASLGIERIVDIGGRWSAPPSSVGGARVTALGRLPAAEISALMGSVRYGFLFYDAARLGKSTIFAAYAAHGLVPVCFGSQAVVNDGLVAGRDLLMSPLNAIPDEDGRSIQGSARVWYQTHSTATLVERVGALAGLRKASAVDNLTSESLFDAESKS